MLSRQFRHAWTERVIRREHNCDSESVVHELLKYRSCDAVAQVEELRMQIVDLEDACRQPASNQIQDIVFGVKPDSGFARYQRLHNRLPTNALMSGGIRALLRGVPRLVYANPIGQRGS